MNGILLIDKPADMSSADVVRKVKQRAGVKVGHLGTLDPFATGVLPLCLGEATKIAQFLNTADKRYEGVMQLGWSTDSGDRTGARVQEAAVPSLAQSDLDQVAGRFLGDQLQIPPMYSALKRDGIPLYRLARRGIEVEREARPIRIDRLSLRLHDAGRIGFVVDCSKGTYVRVLAEDIGAALGTVAHLDALRRTAFGSFTDDLAIPLDTWDPDACRGLISLRDALAHLPTVALDHRAIEAVRQGKVWVLNTIPPDLGETVVLVDGSSEVVAVLSRHGRGWSYGRVIANPVYTKQDLC
jgi:tRNA pseudouridine55 synthase